MSFSKVPCGYCMDCGYGGKLGKGSNNCLHKKPVWVDDDGTVWQVIGPVSDEHPTPAGYVYSTRPFPELGHGTEADIGPEGRMFVRRAKTPAERAEDDRRAEGYARFMDTATASWRHLLDALSERLPDGIEASLWQTGGMCLAIGWRTPEHGPEAYAMLTTEDGPLSPDRSEEGEKCSDDGALLRGGQRYAIGVYIDSEDDGCEPDSIRVLNDSTMPHAGELERDDEAAEAILRVASELFKLRSGMSS